jgi:hypothetical protein
MSDDLKVTVRAYVRTLKTGTSLSEARTGSATASDIARDVAKDEFQSLSESAVIALAKDVLHNLRLTTFEPRTKADAVAIIRGIRGRRSSG